ncbi:MAG: methyltransferase [Nanoarchaeota archaeon]|mgnify:CR=1 FL=1
MVDHYFTSKPSSQDDQQIVIADIRGVHVELVTSSGVFSKSQVDEGSALLIESAVVRPGSDVLDLGCGYGPVGIILAKAFPDSRFTLSDVNERAVDLAKINIRRDRIKNAKAIVSDGFKAIEGSFDAILLNPPQTAGRDLCISLFEGSFYHLKPGGALQIVARHNKGGSTLAKEMERIFGNVKTISRKSGYHVYLSEKR